MPHTQTKQRSFTLGQMNIQAITGGQGRPLLILNDELGYPGWLGWQDALAADRTLLIPHAPGFGVGPRIEWLSSVRDLGAVYARLLRENDFAPIDVIGFSLGGWIAAEMAVGDPGLFRKMVLVAPFGVRPPQGDILDYYELTARGQLEASVADVAGTPEFETLYGGEATPEQFEAFEDARAETARLAWQPFLHNPSLPYLLEGVSKLPTRIIWGDRDRVVPASAMEVYRDRLGNAELVTFAGCGHRPEIERAADFVASVREFLS